jgi:hypothetical protein
MLTQIGVVTGAWAIVLFVWRRRELRG